ncbi:MAG: RSP_7527 family protein [Gammaproteobacteria bacterium]
MTDRQPIHTTANGGIDYAYYTKRGRALRSRAAHQGLRRIWRGLRALFDLKPRRERGPDMAAPCSC